MMRFIVCVIHMQERELNEMTDIVEIADHMINIVEDYAEMMGVSVVIETEIQDDGLMFTVQIMKGDN